MRVLVVDYLDEGHHLEYLGAVQRGLEERGVVAEALTPARHERHREHLDGDRHHVLDLDGDTVAALRGERAPGLRERPRDRALQRTVAWIGEASAPYDAVHLLHIDDLLPAVLGTDAVGSGRLDWYGSLNGLFFNARTWPARFELSASDAATLAARVPSRVARRIVPRLGRGDPFACHTRPWKEIALAAVLDGGDMDAVFVPTSEASAYVRGLDGNGGTEVVAVPDPVTQHTEWGDAEQNRDLPVPSDVPSILFFGDLRLEKGIDLLFEAIERYGGGELAVVVAGSPVDRDASDLSTLTVPDPVTVVDMVGYVPATRVRPLFDAVDGVVLPYRREFGEYRPSGVFQKACAAGKPVIGPDFGFMAERIRRHGLGLTVPPEDPGALATALADFAGADGDVGRPEASRALVADETYDVLCDRLLGTYTEATDG